MCWWKTTCHDGESQMDPITIGTAIAVLAGAKAVEAFSSAAGKSAEALGSAVGTAGWNLAESMLAKVRDWFSVTDSGALEQLQDLEATDDASPDAIAELATLIDDRLPSAPVVEDELSAMLDMARTDSVLNPILSAGTVVQSGRDSYVQDNRGDHNTNVGSVGGDLNINSGH